MSSYLSSNFDKFTQNCLTNFQFSMKPFNIPWPMHWQQGDMIHAVIKVSGHT